MCQLLIKLKSSVLPLEILNSIILALWFLFPHLTGMGKNREYRRTAVSRWLGKKGQGSKQEHHWPRKRVAVELLSFSFPAALRYPVCGFFHRGSGGDQTPPLASELLLELFLLSHHWKEVLATRKVVKISSCGEERHMHRTHVSVWSCVHHGFLGTRKHFHCRYLPAGWTLENLLGKKELEVMRRNS